MRDSRRPILVLSNRLPVRRVTRGGKKRWETSPGGLVTALTPILRGRESSWIGWAGTHGKPPGPFTHDGIRNHPVRLTADDVESYYEGFGNRTLWPLYHDAIRTPEYHRDWWAAYERVNRRFAEVAVRAAPRGARIWIHDYHLQLVPGFIREARSDLRIGFFLHIPFPPVELFSQLPWRGEILRGLLAADVVGFQTREGAQNFARLARWYAGAEGRGSTLTFEGHDVRVDAFPVSVDVDAIETLARSPEVERRSREFHERVGNRRVVLGVDRLDYTKGIDLRLQAYRDLLRAERVDPREVVLVQVAVPSRERVEDYQELRSTVSELVGSINGEHGGLGLSAVEYIHGSYPLEELVALYRTADVMVVTPFRDGMNLVAKEYVVSRVEEDGVLLLSEFTGSARELRRALQVNPYDIDGVADALVRALAMPAREQRSRMRSLRRRVRQHDVFAWARSFLGVLER